MKIISIRHIEGPNVYLYKPILVARIHLESFTEKESFHFEGLADTLLQQLPGLREHHCAKGEPGGFVDRLYGGTYFGHIVEHVTIELSTMAGLDVHYGKTVYTDGPGIYDIIMECQAFACQKSLLYEAMAYVESLAKGQLPTRDVDEIVNEAKQTLAREQLGASTQAIVEACLRRHIPVRRIGNRSLLELGYGKYQKRISATITDNTSCVAVDIASDKELTKSMLREFGIPVPDGGVAETREEVVRLFRELGSPVVIKPLDGRQGRGVSLNVTTEEGALRAFDIARTYGSDILVEQYVKGENVRLLVVNGRCVAASVREPAAVTGDGISTIAALIDRANQDPRRGTGHEKPLTRIQIDPVVEETLVRMGRSLMSIPQQGERVVLRESANLSTGGEARDVTREIHPDYIRLAQRSAGRIGLDVCGIDMVVQQLTVPATASNCAVIELNAAPGIRMHQHPSQGPAYDVADDIVASMFPEGQDGRIPIIAVTGTNGKTTTARLIAGGFRGEGYTVGLTTTGGVYVGETLVQPGDTTGPRSARLVLSDPTVDVAVLETARGGIVRGGLAYDQADVAVLTNVTLDHVGQDCLDTIDDLLHVKSLVAECVRTKGTVVLNADDEQLVRLIPRLKANVVLTSSTSDNKWIRDHVALGGTAFYVESDYIVEAIGGLKRQLICVSDIPLTMRGTIGFHVENSVLATAAMRAGGLSRRSVANALRTFAPESNAGRCMMYRMANGSHVVLDYAHNPAGFARVGEWLQKLPHNHLLGVVGVPGDRADYVVEQSARTLAPFFDAFVVKEDADKRGRQPGEIAEMLRRSIEQSVPSTSIRVIWSEVDALDMALSMLQPGDIACVFYEKSGPLEQLLMERDAVRITDIMEDVKQTYAMM